MDRKYSSIGLLLLLGVTLPYFSMAQSGGAAGSYTQFGSSPRAIAAGNSWVAYAQEGAFIDYNPAFSAYEMEQSQFSIGSALLNFDRQLHVLQGTTPLPPEAGLGLLIRTARVTDFDERSQSGYPLGTFNSAELQALTTFGINLSDQWAIGAGFKLNYARFHPDLSPSMSMGIDLGIHYKRSEHFQWGLVVKDLLSNYRFNSEELYGGQSTQSEEQSFPLRLQTGTALNFFDALTLTGSVELQLLNHQQFDYTLNNSIGGSQLILDSSKNTTDLWQARLGASYPIHPMVTLRAGWQSLDLSELMNINLRTISGGFSITPPLDKLNASIDYAVIRESSNIGLAHVIAIQFTF
ncbi:MAG: hypothetical protein ACQETE_13130 [Bacteroidota bacterium]